MEGDNGYNWDIITDDDTEYGHEQTSPLILSHALRRIPNAVMLKEFFRMRGGTIGQLLGYTEDSDATEPVRAHF